jgi:hypothetical protein
MRRLFLDAGHARFVSSLIKRRPCGHDILNANHLKLIETKNDEKILNFLFTHSLLLKRTRQLCKFSTAFFLSFFLISASANWICHWQRPPIELPLLMNRHLVGACRYLEIQQEFRTSLFCFLCLDLRFSRR